MGLSRYKFGPVFPCVVSGGLIGVRLPTGKQIVYRTGLQVEIPEQVINFVSPTVRFCLEHDNKTYIGRSDGSISIYSPAGTGHLYGLSNWQYSDIEMPVVGYVAFADRVEDIYLDPADNQTIYHGTNGEYFVLPRPISSVGFMNHQALCLSKIQAKENHIKSLVMENGKEVVSNVLWSVATSPGSGNKRRFF